MQNVKRLEPPDDLPDDLRLPNGEISFVVSGLDHGATLDFSVYVENDVEVDGYYYRNLNTGDWDNLATKIVAVGVKTRLDFSLTDGGPYDADRLANGIIDDPGGPGLRNAASGGGGIADATAVPLLSPWGLGVLIALMPGLAAWRRRG